MYYYRRPPERQAKEYFMPFLMILMIGVIIVFGWKILNNVLINEELGVTNERAFLTIENGSLKAMAADGTEWTGIPDKIYLYRGEKVKTEGDGRATLAFWNESYVRLNQDSQLHLEMLRRKGETSMIRAYLAEGHLWAKTGKLTDQDSQFILDTQLLTVSSRDGIFALSSPGTVYILEGSAVIGVKKGNEVVRSYTLGVGQEFLIDEETAGKISMDETLEVIFALDDSFKQSNWYSWNMEKDGKPIPLEEVIIDEENDAIPAGADTSTVKSADETSAQPTTSNSAIPQITEPGKNGEKITLQATEAVITGTVSAGTQGVMVNDYELQRYVPGSKTFSYTAKTSYGNLKAGDNEFKIYGKDAEGKWSESAIITLVLPQEVIDANLGEEPAGGALKQNTGGVIIQEPNNGQDFTTTETEFNLKGVVPVNSAKVMVNDYILSKFEPGQVSWIYKAYSTLGSLKIGEKNLYVIKAYDAEGNLLGEDSITIDVESQGAPVIAIPTPRTSYMTSLNELVLGGTVGKWVQIMYVNDKKLLNYIPGSEKWNHTVKLEPGKNIFKVIGETNGIRTESDEIEITYQP